MRILYIGGTGLISTACTTAALDAGHDVWLLNRGTSRLPAAVGPDRLLTADAYDEQQVRAAVGGLDFDVVVQWVGYLPHQVEQDIRVFSGAGQYVFISTAAAYEKPPSNWLHTEATPLANPLWDYGQQKIACERTLTDAYERSGFPVTIARPSLTYGPSQIPVVIGSWAKPYTLIDRMRRGAPIIVPGDGTSLWTVTHNSDFARGLVGLFGNERASGEAFHITSDESMTWNQIYSQVGAAAGAEPDIRHVPSDGIVAACPDEMGNLWGDKSYSTVFDNSKIRRFVPGFEATVAFADGIKDTVAWFDADPARQEIDEAANARWDRLAAIYAEALAQARGAA
jgi:nucleoside-diphosphate-sugar epimerase